jgi:hypothetical protein
MYLLRIPRYHLPALLLVLVLALCGTVAQANDIIVCKATDPTAPVPAGTSFSFTLDGTTHFTLLVGGSCVPGSPSFAEFHNVGAGDHTITEAATTGSVVSNITVSPADRLDSVDLTLRTVTVDAEDSPTPTTVTFVNKRLLNQGCTPGFWKQDFHFGFWVGFSPTQKVSTVFSGVLPALSGETLLDALQGGGGPGLLGAEEILLRAAVAALLNASNGSIGFPFTKTAVISAVNAAIATGDRDVILALATILDSANNGVGGCPIGGQNP